MRPVTIEKNEIKGIALRRSRALFPAVTRGPLTMSDPTRSRGRVACGFCIRRDRATERAEECAHSPRPVVVVAALLPLAPSVGEILAQEASLSLRLGILAIGLVKIVSAMLVPT